MGKIIVMALLLEFVVSAIIFKKDKTSISWHDWFFPALLLVLLTILVFVILIWISVAFALLWNF